MSKLQQVQRKAHSLKIEGEIKESNQKNKKYMITLNDGSVIHFGAKGYEDYLDHKDEERRKRYLARATKIKDGKGQLTVNDRHSPNFYAVHLLW